MLVRELAIGPARTAGAGAASSAALASSSSKIGNRPCAVALEHDEVVAHEGQRVVDLVGHAGGQQADRGQLLVLHQHAADLVALGEVAEGRQELHRAAVAAGPLCSAGSAAISTGNSAAVLAPPLHLDGAADRCCDWRVSR